MLSSDISSEEIAARLVDQLEGVVTSFYPSAVFQKGFAFCNPKSSKDLGSFQMCLHAQRGQERGQWHRWSQRIGGNVLNFCAYALVGSHKGHQPYVEAFRWAKRFLGLEQRQESAAERAAQQERHTRAQQAAEAARALEAADRQARLECAARVWLSTEPLAGSLGATYLERRGLNPDMAEPELRFAPSLPHPDGANFPAVVARVTDSNGRGRAVWRIYLDEQGGKARVSSPKLGLGLAQGGAVRLGGLHSRIGIAEGIETGLACIALSGRPMPVWATLSAAGMAAWEPPVEIKEVDIYCDNDPPRLCGRRVINAGVDAAKILETRLIACGLKTHLIEPPVGIDFNDLLLRTRSLQ